MVASEFLLKTFLVCYGTHIDFESHTRSHCSGKFHLPVNETRKFANFLCITKLNKRWPNTLILYVQEGLEYL